MIVKCPKPFNNDVCIECPHKMTHEYNSNCNYCDGSCPSCTSITELRKIKLQKIENKYENGLHR